MEAYAAQIDNMDQGIGRIVNFLKSTKQLDNTLIIFLSDNGGNEELEGGETPMKPNDIPEVGEEKPRFSYHREWAQVSNAPFRSYKSNIYEGGIASPLIVHWPNYIKSHSSKTNEISHIIDLMPTILAAAGIKSKNSDGINILPAISGKNLPRKAIYFEHETACAIRFGDWKLVSPKSGIAPYTPRWELYNMKTDRGENVNLADKYPELVKRLAADWDKWALANKVYPLDGRGWWEKVAEK
jgi:arylsulfatase